MAEITPDSSLAEVISSLDLAGVPEKLHCSTCHGFLLNAYKTSCCEQNVCEKCFNQITDHCPMCKHKPFSKELCRPAKAMRNTVKAYLRSVEKTLTDERAKIQTEKAQTSVAEKSSNEEVAEAQAEANREVENGTIEIPTTRSEEPAQDGVTPAGDVQPSIETIAPEMQINGTQAISPSNDENARRQASIESDANDDEVEIQVEPSAEDDVLDMSQAYEMDDQEQQYGNSLQDNSKSGDSNGHEMSNGVDSNGFNMQNMNMGGFNAMGMDMNMMQQMMNMNMNNMMAMGMNPMFGNFGSSNGNMNGMSMMGMNYNPNGMFNGLNSQYSNMWQNNNAMNAMGGDFGSQFGSNMSQQGNYYPQQFPNGDFNGYSGRPGRGRFFRGGRGSYNRGRGSFNQYQQNAGYHNAHDQQQYEAQNTQTQVAHSVNGQPENAKGQTNPKDEDTHDQDDFAPGGQDEVQEALGDDGRDADIKGNEPEIEKLGMETSRPDSTLPDLQVQQAEDKIVPHEPPTHEKIIPEAYHEDFESMAPPSAPTGPSGRYSDKEFAFRARGHNKYSSRGRGSFSGSTGFPASPIRSVSQSSITAASPPAKGAGVIGAPTGPRAMREPQASKPPPARPAGNAGGFQIMGRASMQPQPAQSEEDDRPRSASSVNGYGDNEDDKPPSRRQSKYDKPSENKDEADTDSNHDHDRNDRDRDRKNRRSRRSEYQDDTEMQEANQAYDSPDHKAPYHGTRHDKDKYRRDDKYSSSSKHRSSRRHYEDEDGSGYERDDYGEPINDKHRSSRSVKSTSKYDTTRERDRDTHRDRKRDRDRDRDREEDRPKEKDDRHRKRSRHDRDREDEYDDPDDEESRHRSRRHKKDHHSSSGRRDRDKETDDPDLGLRISGRSNSNRQSGLPTPTSATSPLPPNPIGGPDKDPHTLEREARNRERMLKEQQRREKAALDKRGSVVPSKPSNRTTTTGGRRVSYKYEDEVERGLGAADEREKARWR